VTWNGSLAAAASVTITIQATISTSAAPGSTITNQGTINYDADGNGTNEATAVTDDPGTGASADGTSFGVIAGGGGPTPTVVSASSDVANLLLLALLALGAASALHRRRI
jgi:hypothetical protein